MLAIEIGNRTIVDRYDGPLRSNDAAHHYVTCGRGPQGEILCFYGLHPDAWTPPPVIDTVPGLKYPVYRYDWRQTLPDYPYPCTAGLRISRDSGKSWSDAILSDGWGGSCLATESRIICFHSHGLFVEDGLAIVARVQSDDGGRTWGNVAHAEFHLPSHIELDNLGVFPNWPPENHGGYVEPAMIELQDGTLFLIGRTAYHTPERVMMQCRSMDCCRTWTEPAPSPGIPPRRPVRIQRPVRNEGKMYTNAAGVSPWLAQLPGGIVALT
jgi:hypothetical protein